MGQGTIDYSKGLIYKLCCKDPNITDIYIGSTTNMKNRKHKHKYSCNNPSAIGHNLKVYEFIRNNGGWENWDMILVEYVNCNSKQELEKEERIVIELLKPILNIQLPTRTDKEYYEDNKKKLKEYIKKYREDNKEKLLEKQKKHREKNKTEINEKQKIYYEENKEKYKKYGEKYREKNKEKNKKYYQQNKEQLLEKQKVKVKCEFCECLVNKNSLKRHQNRNICKKFQFIED